MALMNEQQKEKTRAQKIQEQSDKLKAKLEADLNKLEAKKAADFKRFQEANNADAARLKATTEITTGRKMSSAEALSQVHQAQAPQQQDVTTGTKTKGVSQVQTKQASGSQAGGFKDTSGQQQQQDAQKGQAVTAAAQGMSALVQSGQADTSGVGETSTGASVGSGAAMGAGTGAAVGTAITPGIGTAIGAAVGAVVGGITGALKASSNRKKAQRIMFNQKMRQLAALEGEKEDRLQQAMSQMGARMSNALRVPTIRF